MHHGYRCNARTLVLLLPLLIAGCPCDDGSPTQADLTVKMTNTDALPVHIFLTGENFPCCRVDVGDTRTSTVHAEEDQGIIVTAGRNGSLISQATICVVNEEHLRSQSITITWNSNGFACSTR